MTTPEYQKLQDEAEQCAKLIAGTEFNYRGHMLIEIGYALEKLENVYLGELMVRLGQEYNRT